MITRSASRVFFLVMTRSTCSRPSKRSTFVIQDQGNALFFQVLSGHAGRGRAYQVRENLVTQFHYRGLDAPEIRERFGHFQPDRPGADDDRFPDLAFGNGFLIERVSRPAMA